jgi:pimeloyl-ACP methyl ester carboxylesterase
VAHDIGTAAAQLIVARAPERVRRLVLIDGVFGAEWAMEAVAPICAMRPELVVAEVLPFLGGAERG